MRLTSEGMSLEASSRVSGSCGPPLCKLAMPIETNDVYAREVLIARVGHLIRRKQRKIERVILIGLYARRSWYDDERRIDSCPIMNSGSSSIIRCPPTSVAGAVPAM